MRQYIVFFCIALSAFFCECTSQQVNIEAFTHPYDLEQVPIYSMPNKFYSYLQSDTEAGWIITVKRQRAGYFYVKLADDCYLSKKHIWLKAGTLGCVIQDYDSIRVPMYVSADTLSNKVLYIYTSTIGSIYDIKKEMILLSIKSGDKEVQGWVEKKYLCGNPYTTCN